MTTNDTVKIFIKKNNITEEVRFIEEALAELFISYRIELEYNYSNQPTLTLVVASKLDETRRAVAPYRKKIALQGVDFCVSEA